MKKLLRDMILRNLIFGAKLKRRVCRYLHQAIRKRVRNVCHFLKPFHDVTLRISRTLYVTSNTCIEDMYFICTLLDDAISDSSLCDIALAMKLKFDKYFGDIEK